MAKTNKEIVLECFEQVINQKRLDLYDMYFSPDWVAHGQPYVGIGIWYDGDMEPGKVLIRGIAPESPADGVLKVGDEILSITDGDVTQDTYEVLKSPIPITSSVIGTPVEYRVRRDGQEHRFQLQRGLIPRLDMHWKKEDFASFLKETCADLCFDIKMAVEEGEFVAIYGVNTGTWLRTGAWVVFDECDILHVKDGKIIEWWGVTNDAERLRQEGYQIVPPAKKP